MNRYGLVKRRTGKIYRNIYRKRSREIIRQQMGIINFSCKYFNNERVGCGLSEDERRMTIEDIRSGECVCSECTIGITMYHNKL